MGAVARVDCVIQSREGNDMGFVTLEHPVVDRTESGKSEESSPFIGKNIIDRQ